MKLAKYTTLLLSMVLLITLNQCKNEKTAKEEKIEKSAQETAKKPVREEPRLVYDDRGNIIERYNNSYKKSDGSLRSVDSYYYTYDENNNVIKEVKESRDPDGNFKFRNINYYTYDDRNLMIDLVFHSVDENDEILRKAHHSYNYNENGHKIEDIGYAEDGSVISRIILDPDEKGALRSEEYIYYDAQGAISDHKKYYYTQYGLEKTVDLLKDKE
jgi:hypothetical protein